MERMKTAILMFLWLTIPIGGTFAAQEQTTSGEGLTVYTEANYHGKSATFHEDVVNLPSDMNDHIRSLKVAPGEQWEVCEDTDYRGGCLVVSGNQSDLSRNRWSNVISSARRIGSALASRPSGDAYIVLFDRTNFRGNQTNFTGPVANLPRRNAQSVTIGSGRWELCEGRMFTGRCVTLDQNVSDLARHNLRNRVSSIRPVGFGGSAPNDWFIVLFDQTSFRGRATNFQGAQTNISRSVRSVTIGRGVWELCEERNFGGHCVTLDRSSSDLRSSHNLRQVRSVRPLARQPRG